MAETTFRDYMKLGESNGFLAIKATTSFSIATITYDPDGPNQPPAYPPSNGQQMDTYKNVKNDDLISTPWDHRPHPANNRAEQRSAHKRGYKFNPREGTFSALEMTAEERKYLPQIDEDYRTKLREHMNRLGLTDEDEVNYFDFPTRSDHLKQRLAEIRKGLSSVPSTSREEVG